MEETKMSVNTLKVIDLCKTYIVNKRQNHVLRNVNFSMAKGEFVSIMGPSGSGKSTLLYTVSGMDRSTSGDVIFEGKSICKLDDNMLSDLRLNEMGFVFQQMHMLRNLTVFDNIILSAYNSAEGRTASQRKAINERAKRLMRKFEIMDIAENDITEVSGGQLQRACICRAMINDPKMIFADEPTGSLNSKAAAEVMDEFNRMNREGATIMLVTHDVKVAARTEKTLYIVDGNIQGELELGKYSGHEQDKDREKMLSNWLMEMGW
jgi:putative ABC transport system ATP-binding protein